MKKKINRRRGYIPAETYHQIYELYWEENLEQRFLSAMFGVDQGHISRIVNSQRFPYQQTLFQKKIKMEKNIIPSKQEPIQAKVLRAKREKLHNTKLTWKKVEKLRKEYFSGSVSEMDLAKKFGVAQSTITKIIQGLKWKAAK